MYLAGVKRGKNGEIKEDGTAILAAVVTHFTSRELDCQIHSHTIIPNMCLASDNKLMALDSRKIYMNQKILGAVYRSQLATELQKLNYKLEKDNESFRVIDIPKYLEVEFSTRTAQIKSELEKNHISSSSSKRGDLVKLATRKNKVAIELKNLFPIWRKKIESITNKVLSTALQVSREIINTSPIVRLTEKFSSFSRQQLEYEVLIDEVLSKKNIIDLKKTLNTYMKRDDLILISQSEYIDYFTTQKIIDIEEELVELARAISKKNHFSATLDEFNSAIAQFKKETGLDPTDEQVMALEHACLKADFAIIQGSAGAGKSTITRIIKIFFEKRGLNILGTTVVKKAANSLMAETGIESLTVAKIQNLMKENSTKVRSLDALVIDEAGQISSFVLLEILRYAEKNNIKVILSGEDKQLDAINHGGSLAFLMNELGGYRIEKIQRQRTESDRLIVSQFRDGLAAKAFEKLNENGLLNFSNNLDEAQAKLMDTLINYLTDKASKDYIVLASKWSKVDSISKLIRGYLKSIGKISEIEYSRECVVSNHHCILAFAEGDSVRFSRNDSQLGVVNGLSGKIVDLIEDKGLLKFNIMSDSGKTISFSENQYKDDDGRLLLSHAYASTVYSSQGLTVDGDAFILWDSSMHRSLTYVAGSRHRDNSHWFFNKAELNEFRKNAEESYIDIASNISSKDRQKKLAIQSIKEQQDARPAAKAYSL